MGKILERKLFLTWLLLMFCLFIPQVQAADLENPLELEAFFDGALSIQMTDLQIPGAAVALVKDGEIAFSKGYGFADLETKIMMNPRYSLHRTGSNSKILIWIAVMQLVEQGKLDLYADINTYLDFPIPSQVQGRESPPITMHHLMTHTAGFEDQAIGLFTSAAELLLPLNEYVKTHIPARVFQPGSTMAYSNYGSTLAAYIVELVSGVPFSQYAKEQILRPIGMHFSSFEQPLDSYLDTLASQGYRHISGSSVPGGFEYVQAYPAGALSTTVHDMALLMITQLNLVQPEAEMDQQILKQETAKLMQTQQYTAHPELPGMTYGFIEVNYNGYQVLSHGGDTILFTTGLYFLPTENVGLYVAYNSAVGEGARLGLLHSFMDRYFPETSPKQIDPQPIAIGAERHYNGIFHSARSNFQGIEASLRIAQPLYLSVSEDNYLAITVYGRTSLFGEIAPNLFQELNGSDKIALGVNGDRIDKIHFGGPNTWLSTPFYLTARFIVSLLGISVLFFLVTILGWIRGVLKQQTRQRRFTAPKVFAVLFFLVFITVTILLIDIITTTHPDLGIPSIALESSPTLNATLALTKILVGLAALMLLTAIYFIATARGSMWQRIHLALLTLSSLSIIMVLYQMNLF